MRFFEFFIGLLLLFSFSVARAEKSVQFTVSVDWEGRSLSDQNLEAMRRFRRDFPDVRLVHFLNAAYFTKPGVNQDEVREKIRSVIRPGDELGLHIHGWRSLFEAAGVRHRSARNFWGREEAEAEGDVGHQDVIEDFSVDEIRSVIRLSVAILNKNGFHGIRSFRAGGWMGGPKVLEALVREGFTADSSAVPTEHLRPALGDRPLYQLLTNLWGQISIHSEPFQISTPAGSIQEFPDTAGLADYVTARQVYAVFLAQQKRGGGYLHFGFHQETAARYLPEVSGAIGKIRSYAFWRRLKFESLTMSKSTAEQVSCQQLFN